MDSNNNDTNNKGKDENYNLKKIVQSSSSLPSIEKLDGQSNYSSWKFQMELYLNHEDLWQLTTKQKLILLRKT